MELPELTGSDLASIVGTLAMYGFLGWGVGMIVRWFARRGKRERELERRVAELEAREQRLRDAELEAARRAARARHH